MKIFGKEVNAFGSLDILIFIVIIVISGIGITVSAISMLSPVDETTTIFEKFPLNTLPGIGGISIGVFLYKWLSIKIRLRLKEDAEKRELALDYDSAIEIWENLGEIEEAARVRKLSAEMGSVKVAQKVVQGDEVRKTEIKDSVLNRSNVGAGEDDKVAKLEKIANLKKEGLIDDDEFKQMKKEILGK